MPRIGQYRDRYAAEDFRKEIRVRQAAVDLMSKSALAEEADLPRTTLTKRLQDPMGMTFEEFRKINATIHPDPGVVLALLGYSAKEIRNYRSGGKEAAAMSGTA